MKPDPGPSWSISPEEWSARVNYDEWFDTYTPDDAIALHHGGSSDYPAHKAPYDDAKEMQLLRAWEAFHIDTRGWRGLAYGWALGQSGIFYRARGWNTYGAHTGDVDGDHIINNAEIIPVVFLGSGNYVTLSDAAQVTLIRARRYFEAETGRSLYLYGHQEVQGTSTTCPGPKLMDYVKAHRYLREEKEEDMPFLPLKAGDGTSSGRREKREDVQRLQQMLNIGFDAKLDAHGRYDQATVDAVAKHLGGNGERVGGGGKFTRLDRAYTRGLLRNDIGGVDEQARDDAAEALSRLDKLHDI